MPTTTSTKYYRVVGSRRIAEGKARMFLEPVADFQGTAFEGPEARGEEVYDVPLAQRQPDDTIVKVVNTVAVTYTINPTS